jgi:hypothetical protein
VDDGDRVKVLFVVMGILVPYFFGLLNGFLAETDAGEREQVAENDRPGDEEMDTVFVVVTAKGLGDLVGEDEIGEGEGVLAKGLNAKGLYLRPPSPKGLKGLNGM